MILAGEVSVSGASVTKASLKVLETELIELAPNAELWVSRAAQKLLHGLDAFGIDCSDKVALDVGASTGGFTEVLLSRGASKVFALDVGHGQLHPSLLNNPRVVNMEKTNARNLADDALPPIDVIVSDVSFISLTKALPKPLSFARSGAKLVALVKPQFEAGPAAVGKGGIVKDAVAHQKVRKDVRVFLEGSGWTVTGEAESPIRGSDGNVEFLIAAVL